MYYIYIVFSNSIGFFFNLNFRLHIKTKTKKGFTNIKQTYILLYKYILTLFISRAEKIKKKFLDTCLSMELMQYVLANFNAGLNFQYNTEHFVEN